VSEEIDEIEEGPAALRERLSVVDALRSLLKLGLVLSYEEIEIVVFRLRLRLRRVVFLAAFALVKNAFSEILVVERVNEYGLGRGEGIVADFDLVAAKAFVDAVEASMELNV
jgi:hypothetical protein